jgi:hypothetical protein
MTIQSMFAPRIFLRLGSVAVLGLSCAMVTAQQPQQPGNQGQDPALANMAPGDAAAAQQPAQAAQPGQAGDYQQQAPAPIVRSAPTPGAMPPANQDQYQQAPQQGGMPPEDQQPYQAGPPPQGGDQGDAQMAGQQALGDADIYADQAPPALPDYDQPEAPGDNYMWTPGYWGYGVAGYYWVPGVWIVPPYYGALWTPGYWGWYGGRYRWYGGYWGPHIGYYGGVNYGFGYIGVGYFGGYWRGNAFVYNTAVTHVGVGVTNVYNHTVVYGGHTYGPHADVHVSYNGGRGGLTAQPRPGEMAAMHENHTGALPGQTQLRQNAAANPQASFNANHGHVSGNVAVQSRPLGAGRPIASSPAAFQQQHGQQGGQFNQQHNAGQPQGQQRPGGGQQPQHQAPQQQHQQFHPAPQAHSAPHSSNSHK